MANADDRYTEGWFREECNRLFNAGNGNIGRNTQQEFKPMFDRRKATIEAALIVEEWLEKIQNHIYLLNVKQTDLLIEIIEQHMQEVFKRGYHAANNDSHPDNQKSE